EPCHRLEAGRQVMEVVEREETDDGVEPALEPGRRVGYVGGVKRDVVPPTRMAAKSLEENGGEVEALDREAPVGEQERGAPDAAADVEEALAGQKSRVACERTHVASKIRRDGRPHAPLLAFLEVAPLRAVMQVETRFSHAEASVTASRESTRTP